MQVTFKVYRFNPQTDKEPHYDTFTVEAESNERLLDCLNRIRWTQDSSLSFRMSCAHGICGSDGLTINGQAALACQKLVKDYDYTKEILVEPLKYFEVVKDLIVDLKPFFDTDKIDKPPNTAIIESMNQRKSEPKQLNNATNTRCHKMYPLRLLLQRLPSNEQGRPRIRWSSRYFT